MSAYSSGFIQRVIKEQIESSDELPEGVANLYFTEQRVRDTPLTGMVIGAAAPITTTDSVVEMAGKLQAQIDAIVPPAPTDYGLITAAATSLYDWGALT